MSDEPFYTAGPGLPCRGNRAPVNAPGNSA